MIATKKCSKCKEVKPIDEFHGDRTNLDGKRFDCIACVSVRRKKYYAEHRESQKQYTRDYRKSNPEKCRDQIRAYQRTSLGRFAKMRCESRRRGLEFSLTIEQHEDLISTGLCFYCELPLNQTGSGLDRKDSSRGYVYGNCVPCCLKCNLIRGEDNISHQEMIAVARLLKEMRSKEKIGYRVVDGPFVEM